jgi:hypothetical protein
VFASVWLPDRSDLSAKKIAACFSQKDPIPCIRPIIRKLLKTQSGTEILETIRGNVSPMLCHYAGHVVGQELYVSYGNIEDALASCGYACDSACLHGVISQAFAVNLGISQISSSTELAHLGAGQIEKEGKALCRSPEACHGVGHMLFQAYKDIEPAFSACRRIGTSLNCLNGVVMEYSDALSHKSMNETSLPYPNPDTLKTLCLFPDRDEKKACFRYLPKIIESTLAVSGVPPQVSYARSSEVCSGYEKGSDARIACFMGLPVPWSFFTISAPKRALSLCESLGATQDEAACIIGLTSVATQERLAYLKVYCAAVAESFRPICFQSLFHYLQGSAATAEVCAGDAVCLESAAKYATDPWDSLKSL